MGFRMIRIAGYTFHRAYFHALRCIEMTDTFGTFHRIDLVNLYALVNCLVRALRLTDITVDALFGDR